MVGGPKKPREASQDTPRIDFCDPSGPSGQVEADTPLDGPPVSPRGFAITFSIPGQPLAWARPRFNGKRGMVFELKDQTLGKAAVAGSFCRAAGRGWRCWEGPVRLSISAHYLIPKKPKCQDKITRPDLDNVLKAVLDALNGVAYRDDAQVIHIEADKAYSQIAKTIVRIEFVPARTKSKGRKKA